MSSFTFPPPPPPPPPLQAPPQNSGHAFHTAGRGQQSHARGGRGNRGAGRGGRGGQGRGGRGQHNFAGSRAGNTLQGVQAHAFNAQPSHAATQQVGQYHTSYPASQYSQFPPSYPQTHTFAAQPTQQNYATAAHPQYPAQAHAPYNAAAHTQHGVPQVPPQPPYASDMFAQPWMPSASIPQSQPPLMGPPLRMGFHEDRKQNPGRPSSNKHMSPNSMPLGKRKRERPQESPHNTHSQQIPNQNRSRHHQKGQARAKIAVAPAVPSFGVSLPAMPSKPPAPVTSVSGERRKKKKRKTNQLGLTPKGEIHEDSDDDVDEEAAFAKLGLGNLLQFEYRGKASTLNTSGEVARWIAERKKRYPTKARIEEKEREKSKRLEEQKKQAEEIKKNRKAAIPEAVKAEEAPGKLSADERRRQQLAMHLKQVEILRKKLEKSERKAADTTQETSPGVEAREESATPAASLSQASANVEQTEAQTLEEMIHQSIATANHEQPTDVGLDKACMSNAPSMKESDSGDDMSISSSSSDTSSDSDDVATNASGKSCDEAPEEKNSKNPITVELPERNSVKYWVEKGYCKIKLYKGFCWKTVKGHKSCKFRHDIPPGFVRPGAANEEQEKASKEEAKRVTLHARLVNQQQRAEDLKVILAIRYLGDNGFLE